MRRRRTVSRAFVAAALVLAVGSCKRQRAPKVEEVWDEEPAAERAEALGNLAPPWPPPTRALLDDGLLTFWLHESDAVAFHARVLLPTTNRKDPVASEVVAVVAEALRDTLHRRLSRYGTRVEIVHAPGRFEIAIHGRDEHASTILRGLAAAVSPRDPATSLLKARDRVIDQVDMPYTDEIAADALTSRLLGLPVGIERAQTPKLRRLDRRELTDGWRTLTDPRDAVMIVHAGRPADSAKGELRRLSDRWRGTGRRRVVRSATGRLHRGRSAQMPPTRLLASPAEPVRLVPTSGRGRPVLMLGRVVPTDDPQTRSLARLAQRVVQEQMDARLTIAGDRALFVVRIPLSGRDPDGSAERAVTELSELAQTRHQRQRLFQAAQLWLGARVVQASLDGEDWTALWSESIDLADEDADIGLALARDAQAMLEPEPEALQKWQSAWLDPRAGQPGWVWVVAGADRRMERRLARIAPVEPL